MRDDLVGELISAFPETAVIWRALVWQDLNPELSEKQLENRLFEAYGVSRSIRPLEELLKEIISKDSPPLGDDLAEVSRLVLALRVAKHERSRAYCLPLAAGLARALLLLSACPVRRASAEQLWT